MRTMHVCCARLYNLAAAVLYRELRTSSIFCDKKWNLVSAVCLERKPVITCTGSDLENKFLKLLQDIEYENSYKSQHEVRMEMERRQSESLEKGEIDTEIEVIQKQTAQDLEDLYQEESSAFQLAPRTKADEEHDVKSLERKLDKYLVLTVCQKIGDHYTWVLPQGVRGEGESMRKAAERVLTEKCGTNLNVRFWSNAPCGFYKYKYPNVVQKKEGGVIGAKIFFFKAWHISGQVKCDKSFVKDYKWSCSDELGTNLHSDYFRSVSQFIVDS